MKATYKPSRRKPIDVAKQIEAVFVEEAKKVQSMFQGATSTWDHQPDFQITDESTPADLIANIAPAGENTSIFRYVDEGTDYRYAVMSRGFVPKSFKRSLSASSGSGGMSHLDTSQRLPGIEAREFTQEIAERRASIFSDKVRRIIERYMRG